MAIVLRGTAFSDIFVRWGRQSTPLGSRETPSSTSYEKAEKAPASSSSQYLVDWTGPGDPDMPVNWPKPKKVLVLSNVLLVNFIFYTAPGIYSACTPSIKSTFHVSTNNATWGLALFIIAHGFGPLVLSPISSLPSIGRTPVYVLGSLAFCLFNIGSALAKNIQTILILRFWAGFVGTSPTCLGGTTIVEVFGPLEIPYAMPLYVLSGLCGPAFAPLMGTAAVQRWGSWSAGLWLVAGMSAFSTLILFFLLPETLPANILLRRAKGLRRSTGDSRYRSQSEMDMSNSTLYFSMIKQIAMDFRLSFIDPVILFINFHTMLVYGILYLWFEFFPFVFEGIYHFSQLQQSLAFLGIFVGIVTSVSSCMLWQYYYHQPYLAKMKDEGVAVEPEDYITPGKIGAICIPISLFIFAWSSRKDVSWIVPIIGTVFFAPGFHLTFQTALNYLGESYPRHVAGVFAGNTFFRSSFAGAVPIAAQSMIASLGIGWASSLLGFIGLAMVPLLFILQRYGKKWRSWSKYAN